MGDWIALGVLLLILVVAVIYVIRAKKSGKKCIGCPDGSCCSSAKTQKGEESPCSCCCGCGGSVETTDQTE